MSARPYLVGTVGLAAGFTAAAAAGLTTVLLGAGSSSQSLGVHTHVFFS